MNAIERRLGSALADIGDITFDRDVLESYRRDQAAPGLLEAGEPAVLVRPTDTAGVAAAVRAAAAAGMPVVPRGAGSGLSGGANSVDGCMVLSLERMTEIVEVDAVSMAARCGPGVVNANLKAAAAEDGLFYAPDPASFEFSTIGGNVATNAGGMCCVKYGVTRDAVLGLEVVLADGRVVRMGGKTRKNVSGYDLVSLFCGSEGTLGVVTEVTARLIPSPRPAMTMAATFPTLASAGAAILAIVRELTPSMLEVMDGTTIGAVEDMQPMDFDRSTAAVVFARTDSGGATAAEELSRMETLAEWAGAAFVAGSDEEAEGRMLLAARRLAYPALERRGATLLDDVSVPVATIPELLEGIAGIGARQELTIGTFGHAGEGNMHPTIVYPHGDPEASRRAGQAFAEIVELAISLGGVPSGEHGIGSLKRGFLEASLGDAYDVHRQIKDTLDPAGLFNPGKAI